MTTEPLDLIEAAARGVAAAATPMAGARAILDACATGLGADTGHVYLLDLRTAQFAHYVGCPSQAAPFAFVDSDVRLPDARLGTARDLLGASRRPDGTRMPAGTAVYAARNGSCIGVILLFGVSPDELTSNTRRSLVTAADLLVTVYDRIVATRSLTGLQGAVDWAQSDEEFFTSLVHEVGLSTHMGYVALRELEGDDLRCVGAAGDPSVRSGDLDVRVSRGDPYRAALEHGTHVVADTAAGLAGYELPPRPAVGSLVSVRVREGRDIFGTLSLGAACPFNYTALDLDIFADVARAVGLAILNFRTSKTLGGQVREYTEASVAIVGLEVAAAARHQVLGHLDNCQAGLSVISRRLGEQASHVRRDLDMISSQLSAASLALDNIKVAATPPDRHAEAVSLMKVFYEARISLSGLLEASRISVKFRGPDVTVYGSREWLRVALTHLILNSVDAFSDASPRGRSIELLVDVPEKRAGMMRVTYRDNGVGIRPETLRVPREVADMPIGQVIFQPYVSSKKDGTGLGLWLVRRILEGQGGSIDLRSGSGGAAFVIHLPLPSLTPERERPAGTR